MVSAQSDRSVNLRNLLDRCSGPLCQQGDNTLPTVVCSAGEAGVIRPGFPGPQLDGIPPMLSLPCAGETPQAYSSGTQLANKAVVQSAVGSFDWSNATIASSEGPVIGLYWELWHPSPSKLKLCVWPLGLSRSSHGVWLV